MMIDRQERVANINAVVEGVISIAIAFAYQSRSLCRAVIFTNLGLGAIQQVVSDDGVDFGFAQEATASFEGAVEEERGRDGDGGVDAVFDTAEDRHDYASEEDGNFKWRYAPKLVNSIRGSDEIADCVNDDCRERGTRNVEEDCWQGIDSE